MRNIGFGEFFCYYVVVFGLEDELNNIVSFGLDFVGFKGEVIFVDGDVLGYGGGLGNKFC